MTRTTGLTSTLAAGLLAVAGLAAPAAAQQNSKTSTTTSISVSDGKVEGYSIRVIDGTTYRIEFDGDGVRNALIDGKPAEFKVDEASRRVYIVNDEGVVEFEMPSVSGDARGGLGVVQLNQAQGRWPGIINNDPNDAAVGPAERRTSNFFAVAAPNPKTMVGLTQRSLDSQLREHLDIDDGVGTMVLSVVEGLPADKAGLREGDVLISVNGRQVTGASVLTDELARLDPGDELDVTILRKGLPETVTIEVAGFDAEKLYGNRFPGGGAMGLDNPAIIHLENQARENFPFGGNFNFEELEDRIRDELADIRDLDEHQREEIDRAMAQAREQIAQAMKQAERARALQWNRGGDNQLLLRGRDNQLPLLIEREARAIERDAAADELRLRNRELEARNEMLSERLESLESKLDRLLEHLEAQEADTDRDQK